MYIYCITNLINGKKYIGQTIQSVEKRFKRHCWPSTLRRAAMPISLAIKKYGKENFKVELLHECFSQEQLDKMEIYYANNLDTFSPNGYNLRAGNGPGSMSEETKEKIAAANRGQKRSEEAKRNMSNAHKGVPLSQSHRESIAKSLTISDRSRAKTYTFIDPDGNIINFTNMKQFCKTNNLSECNMYRVLRGDRNNYKGWRPVK
jgi:group I intron endonuclease